MDEDMLKNTNYLLSFSEAAVEDQRSSPAALLALVLLL